MILLCNDLNHKLQVMVTSCTCSWGVIKQYSQHYVYEAHFIKCFIKCAMLDHFYSVLIQVRNYETYIILCLNKLTCTFLRLQAMNIATSLCRHYFWQQAQFNKCLYNNKNSNTTFYHISYVHGKYLADENFGEPYR